MDRMIDRMGLYLSLSNLRHKILAGNIANAETPRYRSFDLMFKDIFRRSHSIRRVDMRITDKRHIRPAYFSMQRPKIVATPPLTIGQDGNQVSLEYQMSQLAENTMEYEIVAKLLAKRFEEIKFAISEGR
ncbi:MAG: flagellar basal body rod protein FlgB [Deltaproteobacteria bacterium]|nr:MAG: flagellar basal body rod protein FlgB [Deltaproteobacteria bacterium]